MTKGQKAPAKKTAGARAATPAVLDLDAARAARAEKRGPAPSIILDGHTYVLPLEIPMDAIVTVVLEDIENPTPKSVASVMSTLATLFGDDWEAVRPKLSVEDCMMVLTGALGLYGTSLPESGASASS